MEPIINPSVPYVGPIHQNFTPGKWIKIYGIPPVAALRFTITLKCTSEDDIALEMSINITDNNISVNSMRHGIWDEAQTIFDCPIKNQTKFEIALTCDYTQYKIFIDGNPYCDFPQRITYDRITRLTVDGDVSIELITSQEAERPRPPPVGFIKQIEAETPPPSYNEVQSKMYYVPNNSMNYGSCAAPYPTNNATFAPAIPAYPPYPIQPDVYPTQTGTTVPLNAASSNFRPVAPSKSKKYFIYACVIFVLMIIVVIGVINKNSRGHYYRHHDYNHVEDY